jgi:hypothetical protein
MAHGYGAGWRQATGHNRNRQNQRQKWDDKDATKKYKKKNFCVCGTAGCGGWRWADQLSADQLRCKSCECFWPVQYVPGHLRAYLHEDGEIEEHKYGHKDEAVDMEQDDKENEEDQEAS